MIWLMAHILWIVLVGGLMITFGRETRMLINDLVCKCTDKIREKVGILKKSE